jgi:Zn-dependent protease with chaperone function
LPNRLYLHKLSAREYAGACFKTWVFFLGLIASAPLLSWAMGPEWNLRSASVAVLYLAAYVWFICTGWVWMMRRFGAIVSAAPEVGALVREQAMARKILVKQVLFLEDFRALAFALPLQRSVLLTRKLVSLLSPEELRTVVDHELGHLGEPRGVLIGRIIGAMAFVPLPFLGVAADWHGIRGIAACYVAWMVIAFGSKRLARSMELRADHFAIESDQPGTAKIYASALEKIYSENLVPASGLARSQAHPDLYDRMLAAGIQPDFPRPAKPAYAHWTVLIWILLVFGLLSAKTLITGIAPQL